MKYTFEKVVDGLSRYIDAELYPHMNDLQEFMARVLVGRFLSNESGIKESLVANGFLRTFGVLDGDGMVDVDALIRDIKRELIRKKQVSFSIPMFGRMTFSPEDADKIHKLIVGEELHNENHQEARRQD